MRAGRQAGGLGGCGWLLRDGVVVQSSDACARAMNGLRARAREREREPGRCSCVWCSMALSVSYTPLLACGLWLRMEIEERRSYEPARSGKARCSWALGAAYARACCGWRPNAKPRPSRLPRWDTRLHLRHHPHQQQREARRGTARYTREITPARGPRCAEVQHGRAPNRRGCISRRR